MSTAMIGRLSEVKEPWVYLTDIDSQEFKQAIDAVREEGYMVTELDCSEMLNLEQLFDVFGAAADFPDHFGRNWPAFDDCLADLEWLPASGYVFILKNPQALLEDEPIERVAFWRIITKVAAEWAAPVNLGEWWDREGVPFHVVLDMTPEIGRTASGDRIAVSGIRAAVLSS